MRERVSSRVTTIAQMGRSAASGQPTLERQRRDRRPRATEPEAEAAPDRARRASPRSGAPGGW